MRFTRQKNDTIVEVISGLFIFLFVYTAFSKFLNFNNFSAVLGLSPLIGGYAKAVAAAIPIIELMITAFLLIPKLRRFGLVFSFLLITVFTIYILYMVIYVPNLPCSCGGVIQHMTWNQHIIFNLAWLILALSGLHLMNKQSYQLLVHKNRNQLLQQ
jgi:hypothetical protein